MHWFEPKGGIAPFAPERWPIYICEVADGVYFYGFPATGGPQVGVKVAFHNIKTPTTPMTIKRDVSPEEQDQLRDYLRRFIPDLAGPCLESVVCMYTSTPDEHFVIGPHPVYPQVILAGGFSGHGFKFASVIGEVLAGLALQERPEFDLDLFSPGRFNQR